MTTPELRAETLWGSTVITTEVACLVSLESLLELRYLAERIWVALSLRIACRIYGKSSSSSWGRNRRGRPWMASGTAVGARTRVHPGLLPTGKDWLRALVRESK